MIDLAETFRQIRGNRDQAQTAQGFFKDINIEFLLHELKDPVAVIESGIQTLLERREKTGPLTLRQEKTLLRTLRNARKARQMLGELLEVGRSEAGCLSACRFSPIQALIEALNDALQTVSQVDFLAEWNGIDTLAPLLAEHHINLELIRPDEIGEIHLDVTKFRQIIGNLIKNALHHRCDWIHIQLSKKADFLMVEVSDDGPGIKSEHRQVIFQRYSQVKEDATLSRKGHGLGLAGARILARCMGGDVEVVGAKYHGATFRVTLPLSLDCSQQEW